MDQRSIGDEIKRKIHSRLKGCLCDVIINPNESVKFVCVGADFVVIIKSNDEYAECIRDFFDQNKLNYTAIDPDTSVGAYIMELSGLSEIDLPVIYSTKQESIVDGWRCPEYMGVVLE